jgi:hypothetical protein
MRCDTPRRALCYDWFIGIVSSVKRAVVSALNAERSRGFWSGYRGTSAGVRSKEAEEFLSYPIAPVVLLKV